MLLRMDSSRAISIIMRREYKDCLYLSFKWVMGHQSVVTALQAEAQRAKCVMQRTILW